MAKEICCLCSIQIRKLVQKCVKGCASVVASASLYHELVQSSNPVHNVIFWLKKSATMREKMSNAQKSRQPPIKSPC